MITTNWPSPDWTPAYERWRHGGWYVTNAGYVSGCSGVVSRNYADKAWRVVDDPRPFEAQPTYSTRDEAARACRAMATTREQGEEDLRREREHYADMRERFGKDGSTAAFSNWSRAVDRYCARFGHLPPAELVSVADAKRYAHLPEHPAEEPDPVIAHARAALEAISEPLDAPEPPPAVVVTPATRAYRCSVNAEDWSDIRTPHDTRHAAHLAVQAAGIDYDASEPHATVPGVFYYFAAGGDLVATVRAEKAPATPVAVVVTRSGLQALLPGHEPPSATLGGAMQRALF